MDPSKRILLNLLKLQVLNLPFLKLLCQKKAGSSNRWKDWKKDDDKARRKIQELERRKKKGSTKANMSKRKAVKAMVTAECDRTGTDISIEENRVAIASRVLNLLERPKKEVLFVSADHTEIMHLGWWLVH